MKIKIRDEEFEFVSFIEATNTQLIALHRETGLTFEDLQRGADKLSALDTKDPADAVTKVLSDIDILCALGAVVFLARWNGGQRCTFEQATDVPFAEINFVAEPGDDFAVVSSPESPTLPASAAGGNRAARRATSPSRSTRSRAASSVE